MRQVTLQSILDRARILCDQRDKNFITDAEALSLVNDAFCSLYDDLVGASENYYTSTYSFTISSGTTDYVLPPDFYKLLAVDYATSATGSKVTLYKYNEAERNNGFTNPSNIPNGTIFLTYVPAPPIFTDLTTLVDGFSGWDQLLALQVAIDMMDAEEGNTDRLMTKYKQRLEKMMSSVERDQGMPSTVVDLAKSQVPYQYSTIRYRLYQSNIRFVSTQYVSSIYNGVF